ncbi:MAG: hypothetical protein V7709_02190 [Halioglobus sp.]
MSLFAAADSWSAITGLAIASLLSIVTGIVAGFATTTLVHEWFHYLGARLTAGDYEIPKKMSLFVFDWSFPKNNLKQFYTMSIAGSFGGLAGIALLWLCIPTDTAGRAALVASGVASFAFAAVIEWPVLMRTRKTGDPLGELSKIDERVLMRATLTSALVGWFSWAMM